VAGAGDRALADRGAVESGHEVLDDLGQPRVLRADVLAVLEYLDRMRRVPAGADQADAHVGAAHVGRDERRVGVANGFHGHRVGGCGHVVFGRPPAAQGAGAVKWAGVWKYVDNDVNTLLAASGRGRRNDDKNSVYGIRFTPLNAGMALKRRILRRSSGQRCCVAQVTTAQAQPSAARKTWLVA